MKTLKFERKNHITVLLIAVALVILLFMTMGQADAATVTVTESEPNDYRYQAKSFTLTDKAVLKGTVEWKDFDWFILNMPFTGRVKINAEGSFGYNIRFLLACEYDNGSTSPFASTYVNYKESLGYAKNSFYYYLSKGRYYIGVEENPRETDYTITLQGIEVKDELAEPNDYLECASELKVGETKHAVLADTSVMARRYHEADVDFVKIKIPTSGTYYINCKFDNELERFSKYPRVNLYFDEYNLEGEHIGTLCGIKGSEDVSYTRGVIPVYFSKGTHYIKVSNWPYDEDSTSYALSITKKLTKPNNVKISKTGSSKIKLSWSEVKSADGYIIYRKSTKTGNYIKIGTTSKKSYVDTGAKRYQKNSYKIRAYRTMNRYNEKGFYSNIVSKWM